MKILCIYNASSTWVGELSYLFGKKIFQNEQLRYVRPLP